MRRRILYVIGSLNVGGAERHLTNVAVRLKRRGWEPEIFALSPHGPLADSLSEAGVPVYGVTLPKWLVSVVRNDRLRARIGLLITVAVMVVTIWRRRPHVIHLFLPAAYIVGGLASLLTLVPARIMSRRSLNAYQSKHLLFARIERHLHPRMDLICGNSRAVVDNLRHEGVEAAKLRLIYNGIDVGPFEQPFDRRQARTEMDIPPDATVFVIVANLIPYKGHADLIAAFAKIKGQLEGSWVLLCVGRDDGIGGQLQLQIDSAGLRANIRLTGARSDVPDEVLQNAVGKH